jgi:hypothetical protein
MQKHKHVMFHCSSQSVKSNISSKLTILAVKVKHVWTAAQMNEKFAQFTFTLCQYNNFGLKKILAELNLIQNKVA